MVQPKSLLMVVTSCNRIDAEHDTGLWYEEFALPYTLFTTECFKVVVASIQGGAAPIDPKSMPENTHDIHTQAALEVLGHTHALKDLEGEEFGGVFFAGGHGTMFDFPRNPYVTDLVSTYLSKGRIVAAVCHGPAALVNARAYDGSPVVQGRRLTTFSNAEEEAVEMTGFMPFLLEDKLRQLGAEVVLAPMWKENVVADGRLVTGQNPQSSEATARVVLELLNN